MMMANVFYLVTTSKNVRKSSGSLYDSIVKESAKAIRQAP